MPEAQQGVRRSDEVAEALARDIRSGHFGSGSWLKQIALEERYGASRADVRRALDILLLKRVVERIPERGFYVPEVDARRQSELREVRVVLESAMAPSVIENADAEALEKLSSLASAFRIAVEQGSVADRYETNFVFHEALTKLCFNRELASLVIELRGYSPATPVSQWPTHARAMKSADEHFAMVDAIRNRDTSELKRLFKIHIIPEEVA